MFKDNEQPFKGKDTARYIHDFLQSPGELGALKDGGCDAFCGATAPRRGRAQEVAHPLPRLHRLCDIPQRPTLCDTFLWKPTGVVGLDQEPLGGQVVTPGTSPREIRPVTRLVHSRTCRLCL